MGSHSQLISLLAGVAFFIYGMQLASEYLQKIAANRIRKLFNSLSGKRLLAIFVGIMLTILLQSSGAVTSMLVTLGTAGVVTLHGVMGVIIGSAIGSTFQVQLISFHIHEYGLAMFLVGFAFYLKSKKRFIKNIAGAVIGFGIMFFGLELMGDAADHYRESPYLTMVLNYFKSEPFITILFTAAFSGFVQSSAVVVGFAMTLAMTGLISFYDSMFWIYGANIGTTATAILAATGGNYIARQVAWSHFFFKVGGVLIFLPFTALYVSLLQSWEPSEARNIANAHTLFNILNAILFYPFLNIGARFMQKYIQPTEEEKEFGPEFLSKTGDASTLAYAQAMREALRMGDLVSQMVKKSLDLFENENPELVEELHEQDNKVDLLYREIKSYLLRFSDGSGHFDKRAVELLSFITDIEAAADMVDKNLIDLSEKKNNLKLEFSRQGWMEIREIHKITVEIVSLSISAYQLQSEELARQVVEKKRHLRQKERLCRESHLERLHRGLKETVNTSSIHLELLGDYRRIAGLCSNHAYTIIKEAPEES